MGVVTLYGDLVDRGEEWLFTPARRLDPADPDFGSPVRLAKRDVIASVRVGAGLDWVRVRLATARMAGLLPERQPQRTRYAMYAL